MAITTDEDPLLSREPDPRVDGEFSGSPGLIQPPPHELTAHEQLMYMTAVDPLHAEDDPENDGYLEYIGLEPGRSEWG
jgi:hypothetical protein